jgi:hypothetical protein
MPTIRSEASSKHWESGRRKRTIISKTTTELVNSGGEY